MAIVGLLPLGHTPDVGAQEPAVMTATAHITRTIPVGALNIEDPDTSSSLDPSGPGDTGGTQCTWADINVDRDRNRFEFVDEMSARMCGHAVYTITLPPGAKEFVVHFNASRNVTSSTPVVAKQEIRLTHVDSSGSGISSYSYFDSADHTNSSMRPFLTPYTVPDGAERLNLTWSFEDVGTELVMNNPLTRLSATAFNATVADPRIEFADITLPDGTVVDTETTDVNQTRTITTTAEIDIPDLLLEPDDEASVSIQVGSADDVVGIRAPQGIALNLERIRSVASGSQLVIVLDNEILRNIGPGTYTFTFQRTETLPPPAAPAPPATIYPLVYLLSLLPAPTAAYAYTQVWRVRQVSEKGLGRAGGLYVGAAALTLAYAGLLGFVYLSGRLAHIATLPVGGEDAFVFAGFVLLALAFIALGALVARSVLRALKRDLDERRRIQKELERSNQELEHFAYVASHDLQEPLRTISGFSQLLQKRYGDELDERALRYITRTVEGTDRMSRLIHDLLEYSRVDSRGRPLEPTDLNKLMDEVRQDLETMIQTTGAKVTSDHLPTVLADRTQVAQVLSNLVRNAIKYHHPDRPPQVHVSSSQEDGAWLLSVRDNGVGIPEDQQERAFVIFQRLVPRETDDTGTGLGLAISRKIVERHGGRIWVESDGASGSTFRFTLPRDPSTNGDRPAPKRKTLGIARRQRGNSPPS